MSKIRTPIDQMIAKSNQGAEKAKGIVCPKCGCVQVGEGRSVHHTVHVAGGNRRYRKCRACGHEIRTFEQIG